MGAISIGRRMIFYVITVTVFPCQFSTLLIISASQSILFSSVNVIIWFSFMIKLVGLLLTLVCFSMFGIEVVLSSSLDLLLFSFVSKGAVVLSWLSILWVFLLLFWEFSGMMYWMEGDFIGCTLQTHAFLYFVPWWRNKTGPSCPNTFAGPFHSAESYNKPFHWFQQIVHNCLYSFSGQVWFY